MRGSAPATFERYSVYLRQFEVWLGSRAPAEVGAGEIADQYLAGWWDRYEGRYGKSPSTNIVRNHHTALSSFFNFLEARDYVPANPMRKLVDERPKGQKKPNDFLSQSDDLRLLAAPNTPEERIIMTSFCPCIRWVRVTRVIREELDASPDRDAQTQLLPAGRAPKGLWDDEVRQRLGTARCHFVATVYALRMGKFVANLALLAVFTVITVPWLIGILWIIDLAAHRVG